MPSKPLTVRESSAAVEILRILRTLTLDEAITVTSVAMAFVDRKKADEPEDSGREQGARVPDLQTSDPAGKRPRPTGRKAGRSS